MLTYMLTSFALTPVEVIVSSYEECILGHTLSLN